MSSFSDYAPGPTLYWPAGTSARWRLALRQCRTCPALDLTDAQEVEFIFKRTATTPDASALFTKKLTTGGIVAADLALGLVDVLIDDSDTSPANGYSDWVWITRVTLEDGSVLQPFGVSGAARLDAIAPSVEGILAADSTTGTIAPVALTPAPLPAYATVAYVDARDAASVATAAADATTKANAAQAAAIAASQPLDADLTAYANAADAAARRGLINAAADDLSNAAAQAALRDFSAQLITSPAWGFLGDSITNGSSASNAAYAFPAQSITRAGGLVASASSTAYVSGVAGNTTAAMIARADAFFAQPIKNMVLLAGTNDAGQSVPIATYIDNMTTLIRRAKGLGWGVVVATIPPRGSSQSQSIRRAALGFNHWINTYVPGMGCEVADAYTALADPTTGLILAAYDADGVHPNTLGHSVMADVVAAAMQRVAARTQPVGLLTAKHDAVATFDPLCAGGTTKPASWFEQPGGSGSIPTFSLVANAGAFLPAGQWFQVQTDGTATNRVQVGAGVATIGDRVALCAHVEVEVLSGDWRAAVAAGTAQVGIAVNSAGANVQIPYLRNPGLQEADGIYRLSIVYPYTATTTENNLWVRVVTPDGVEIKARVGCVGIVNLTTLGASSVL